MALAGDSCECSLYRCLGLRNNRTRASTALQGTVGYPILKKKKEVLCLRRHQAKWFGAPKDVLVTVRKT